MAFFSIIIPTFNIAEYLSDCLISIQLQDFKDYEVIVVDDGSTDNTIDVVKSFPAIRFFSLPHGGVSAARNFGLKEARGEYVWFVDGDDYLRPDCLSKIYNLLQNKGVDCCSFEYCKTNYRYSEANSIPAWGNRGYASGEYYSENEDFHLRAPRSVAILVFRRALAEGVLFEKISYCEDWLFALTIWFRSKKVCYWNAEIYFYYQRPGSSIYNMKPAVVDDFLSFCHYALKMACDTGKRNVREYVEFCIRETIILCIMTYIYKDVKDKSLKICLFKKMCNRIIEFNKDYEFPLDRHLRKIVESESYFLGCFWLYWRYKPRHFLAKHPIFIKIYKALRIR